MHALPIYNSVAAELGVGAPVLHSVLATHRYFPEKKRSASRNDVYNQQDGDAAGRGGSVVETHDSIPSEGVGAEFLQTLPHCPQKPQLPPLQIDKLASDGEPRPPSSSGHLQRSIHDEIAMINARLNDWKEKRLAEAHTTSTVAATSVTFALGMQHGRATAAAVEGAMQCRILNRRIEEQKRAQRRVDRLLTSLIPLVDEQLERVTAPSSASQDATSSSSALRGEEVPHSCDSEKGKIVTLWSTAELAAQLLRQSLIFEQQHWIEHLQMMQEESQERRARVLQCLMDQQIISVVEDEAEFRAEMEKDALRFLNALCALESVVPVVVAQDKRSPSQKQEKEPRDGTAQ